jgi:MAF protein
VKKIRVNKIILASSSPRRKELLEREGIDFIVDASSIEEILDLSLSVEDRLMKLATDKAKPIHDKYPNDIVIGADTIVYFNDEIIGKPRDIYHAKEILESLNKNKHSVYSAVAIYNKDELITFIDKTDVYFKDITSLIDEYLNSDEWNGKAGAYAIQGKASCFIDHIDGDIDTVIGLPTQKVINILNQLDM